MPTYTGSCYCRAIQYQLNLTSPDDARTSLCHCRSCKKAFGTNYGLTAKVAKGSFEITQGKTKEHAADNGSGVMLYREFCETCGSFILEYGNEDFRIIGPRDLKWLTSVAPKEAAKEHFRYITVGTLDDPESLPPKGEFFCKYRAKWMPEIPGQ
ncbi:hypothetical protein GX50_05359 [[Emmonsia] crescens]|uniref:CENP-V/GFA domain-containing protein n=1 Tax=[Emmonsia] crescens TaxID=73230 RepID=A0A2B7ZEQ0_9EURO|nr:hypothetical protein GX50_05359 [Emmonsia crescens]